jgi:hypothetical protein
MAVTINAYPKFLEYLGPIIDFSADTLKGELHNSLTHTSTHTQRSDVSASALATANGYTNPGQTLASVTWVETSGTIKLDSADVSWTASGGSIGPATDLVLYDDTTASPVDALLFDVDFGESKTAGDGTAFLVTVHANGWFTGAFA